MTTATATKPAVELPPLTEVVTDFARTFASASLEGGHFKKRNMFLQSLGATTPETLKATASRQQVATLCSALVRERKRYNGTHLVNGQPQRLEFGNPRFAVWYSNNLAKAADVAFAASKLYAPQPPVVEPSAPAALDPKAFVSRVEELVESTGTGKQFLQRVRKALGL